jgi:hypothetical protein
MFSARMWTPLIFELTTVVTVFVAKLKSLWFFFKLRLPEMDIKARSLYLRYMRDYG